MSYIDWKLFDSIPANKIRIINDSQAIEEKLIKKFICQSPIGTGKSTAIRKWIYNTVPDNKFIVVVPTINIAMEFYSKLYVALNNKYPNDVDDMIKVCVKDGAFKEFKSAITKFIPTVITTYATASKCLGGIIEHFYHHSIDFNKHYSLIIDEAHLLLENISLIETCREFDKVGLITATASDINCLSVFKDYVKINPHVEDKYNRTIYIHKLKNNMEEQREIISKQVVTEMQNYDKILIKIEDKKECERIKECINNELIKALYNSDKKEVEISDEGKFVNPEDVDIIIATSYIQAGQSLKENILSIFIQTQLDSCSSVEQFIGRNRNSTTVTHLYLRMIKVPEDKFSYKIAKNRYKTRLNQLRANAWQSMDANSWMKCLSKIGTVIIDYVKEQPKITINEEGLNTDFSGKKQLYQYFGLKNDKEIPAEYELRMKVINEKGKRKRMYKLVKSK